MEPRSFRLPAYRLTARPNRITRKRETIVNTIIMHRHYQNQRRFQARSKDQEILEEGGGAGPSTLPRRDHE